MKTIASLAIATLTFIAAPATQAHDHCSKKKIITNSCTSHNYSSYYSSCSPYGSISVSTYTPHTCAPVFVGTQELSRTIQTQYGYDAYGNLVGYNVLVITYADYYSNGSSRTYTRSYRV